MSVPQTASGSVLEAARFARRASLTDLAPSGAVLVIVPHPDDEALGCGEALAACAEAGLLAGLILMTDGEGSHPASKAYPPERLIALRRCEFERSLAILADGVDIPVLRLGLADGQVEPGSLSSNVIAPAKNFANRIGAGAVWTTWEGDPHCDHQAAARLARLIARTRNIPLRQFIVWGRFGERDVPRGLHRFASPAHQERKARAIHAHVSQVTALIDDDLGGFFMPTALMAHFERSDELFVFDDGELAP